MNNENYKSLKVWKKGIEITNCIYDVTDNFSSRHQYGIGSHMEKSAVSIPSNIAEGKNRKYTKEFIRFCYIAIGSCAELETQVIICFNRNLISQDQHDKITAEIQEEMRMLLGLVRSM
jgi:four helix bundle protein